MEQESFSNTGEEIEEGSLRPDFIRDFSKETGQDLRDEKAKEIRQARMDRRNEIETKSEELEIARGKAEQLRANVNKIDNAFWAKLPLLNKLSSALTREDKEKIAELDAEIKKSSTSSNFETKDPREMMDEFYKNEEERWEKSDFTKEDTDRYFSEEYLSLLGLQDYLLLCSRFNTEFATHVTRQGVRDHIAMREHVAGKGEVHHGFEEILEDGRLKAVFGNILMQEDKEKALANYFSWLAEQVNASGRNFDNQSDRKILEVNMEGQRIKGMWAGSYSDHVAVHMGLKAVLDDYYGGEQGNELFFLVPMAHIMKEYKTAYVGPPSVDFNNNLWIWDQEHRGVSINTGIVCIAESAPVDPRNGSTYELDEQNEPIVNQENLEVMTKLCGSEEFIDFIKEATMKIYEARKNYHEFPVIQQYREELKSRFGVNDPRLNDLLLSNWTIYQQMESQIKGRAIFKIEPKNIAEDILSENGCLFTRAKNTIPSKEYWENYFKEHPELKPSKIYYYNGSPNSAVESLRYKYGLEKYGRKQRAEDLYPESQISVDAKEEISPSYDEFFALAEKVLDKYFPEEPEQVEQKEEQLI